MAGKDGPVYSAEELKNFCLVAVIGARERCLRDDFRPLHLQNPWKTGRLFVRQKKVTHDPIIFYRIVSTLQCRYGLLCLNRLLLLDQRSRYFVEIAKVNP